MSKAAWARAYGSRVKTGLEYGHSIEQIEHDFSIAMHYAAKYLTQRGAKQLGKSRGVGRRIAPEAP